MSVINSVFMFVCGEQGMLTLYMFYMPIAIYGWVGALNAHISFFYVLCVFHRQASMCMSSKLSPVCAHMAEKRLCVSSGVPSVSLSLITV